MAKIYPSDLPGFDTFEIKSAEIDTLKKLQFELPAEYSVFHSVHWSRAYEKNTAYGEIDFIIMNNTGKVLVIEQKNGMLEETQDGLVKSYGLTKKSSRIKSSATLVISGINSINSTQEGRNSISIILFTVPTIWLPISMRPELTGSVSLTGTAKPGSATILNACLMWTPTPPGVNCRTT